MESTWCCRHISQGLESKMIEENGMHAWQLRGLGCSVGFKPGHDDAAVGHLR
jgi:hypothetical protein